MTPPALIMSYSNLFIFSETSQTYIENPAFRRKNPRPRIAKRRPKPCDPLDALESFVWCADEDSGVFSWVHRCNKCNKPAWKCANICH